MFPGLRDRIGNALDLVVEFSTLGEYRLAAPGAVAAAGAPPIALEQAPRPGGAGSIAGVDAERRAVAGGAVGRVPIATPAARARPADRLPRRSSASAPRTATAGVRQGACPATRAADAMRALAAANGLPDTAARPPRRVRNGAAAPPEQLCLAV